MPKSKVPTAYTKDVARKLAGNLQITLKDASLYTNEVVKIISEYLLSGTKVHISEIGILQVKDVKERNVRNPKSGECFVKPAYRKLGFRATKHMKQRLN